MSRLPIRWQVTLAFAAALALVLAAVGAFLYLRLDAELSRSVDVALRSRVAEISAQPRRSGPALSDARPSVLAEDAESFAQLLSPSGAVLETTARVRGPLLDRRELRSLGRSQYFERDRAGPENEPARLLAVPVRSTRGRVIVVAGASLDEKRETLATLLALELVGLSAALLLASGAGYWVSGLALRPVEAMRRRAGEISGEAGRRLPVPPVDDEIGRLGKTLNAMLERINAASSAREEAMAKERRFVADASHELRTPLTTLRSEVDVALSRKRTVGELRAALASAGEEATRLTALANDLLALAAADEGQLVQRSDAVPAADLLGAVAGRYADRVQRAGREIVVAAPGGLMLRGDIERLEQLVGNLVDNALAHGNGTIELTARSEGGQVVLAVRDHGPGIPDGFLDRAFERFARPDSGRAGGGAGLGLAIVKAIADAHGGSVSAADAGPGARIEAHLPALIDSSSRPATLCPQRQSSEDR